MGEAIQAIVIRFVVGETVQEQFADSYLWIAALITVLSLGALLYAAWRNRSIRFLLGLSSSWLLIPTICVLTLAMFVPKFNVRYVMLALPGLILLWSCGSVMCLSILRNLSLTISTSPPIQAFSQLGEIRYSALAILSPLLIGFTVANSQWYFDHAFLKAQWREAAAYVRLHHEVGEAVVLVSGHTWPVWDYYAPDFPAIHLPDLQILDVDAVLDFTESGTALQAALQGYNGAWLVNWQDEVVDPTGLVPVQLAWAGREKTFRSQFWEVGLRRFIDLDPQQIPTSPPLNEELQINFANQLTLVGYTITEEDEVLLFWRRGSAAVTDSNWQLNLRTFTTDGLTYHTPADRLPTNYTYPLERWRLGEIVMGLIPALDWAGPAAMPDAYQIQIGIYDPTDNQGGLDRLDSKGQPQGKYATLAIQLREHTTDRPLIVPEDIVQVNPDIRLHMTPSQLNGEPGQYFVTTLLWYLEDTFQEESFVVRWRTLEDERVVAETALALPSGQPLALWPRHDWLRQLLSWQVPVDLAPGVYWLSLEPENLVVQVWRIWFAIVSQLCRARVDFAYPLWPKR